MSKEKLVTESCHAQGFFGGGCCCFCFNSTNVNSQSLTSTHQIQFSSNWFYCFACKFITSLDYLVCLATRGPPEFIDRSCGFPLNGSECVSSWWGGWNSGTILSWETICQLMPVQIGSVPTQPHTHVGQSGLRLEQV